MAINLDGTYVKLATEASPSRSDTRGTSPTEPAKVTLFTAYFITVRSGSAGSFDMG